MTAELELSEPEPNSDPEPSSGPWRGRPELDAVESVDPTTPLPVEPSRINGQVAQFSSPRGGSTRRLVRAAAAGARLAVAQRRAWVAEPRTSRQWQLDQLQSAGIGHHEDYDQLADNLDTRVKERRGTMRLQVAGGVVAGVVLLLIAIFAAVWLFIPLAAGAVGTLLRFSWMGRNGYLLDGDGRCERCPDREPPRDTLGCLVQSDPHPTGEPTTNQSGEAGRPSDEPAFEVPELTQESLESTLRAANLVGAEDPVEIFGFRPVADNGSMVHVRLPKTVLASKVLLAREQIAGVLDIPEVQVHLSPGTTPRRFSIWLAERDPLTGIVSSRIGTVDEIDAWDGVPIGMSIDGKPIKVNVMGGHHLLVVGDTRSGKTMLTRLMFSWLAKDPHCRMLLLDPQGLGGWDSFADLAEVVTGADDDTIGLMLDRLERVLTEEFDRRRKAINNYRQIMKMQVNASKLTRQMARDAAHGVESLVIATDECHTLLNHPKHGARATEVSKQLVQKAAAFGITLVFLTQEARNDSIDPGLRNLINSRICLSVETPASAKFVLGDDYLKLGMNPVALELPRHAGAFYVKGPVLAGDAKWMLGKGEWLDDNEALDSQADALAMRRRLRPALLPGAARTDPEPTLAVNPDDPQHLENVIDVYRGPEDQLWSKTIIERLQHTHSVLYDGLSVRGMNDFLRPFDLATKDVRERGTVGKGLYLRDAEDALEHCSASAGDTAAQILPLHPPLHSDTPSDLRCSDAAQIGGAPTSDAVDGV